MAATLLVNIDVDDLDRAVAFYTGALGLTVGRRFGAFGVELTGGALVWEHALPEASATYTLATDGARVFVAPYDTRSVPRHGRSLLALDSATGAVLWSFAHQAHSYSGAAVLGDAVFVTTADGAIHALDGATGAVRWSQPHPEPTSGSKLLALPGSPLATDRSGRPAQRLRQTPPRRPAHRGRGSRGGAARSPGCRSGGSRGLTASCRQAQPGRQRRE